MMDFTSYHRPWREKLVGDVAQWRTLMGTYIGNEIVLTNGCFDILHFGHIELLQAARTKGNLLVVAVNSDASVHQLKGPKRPLVPEMERLAVIAALEAVDYCFIFHEKRCDQVIKTVSPHYWVKGGDYTLETLDADERRAAQSVGAEIVIIPYATGHSTTDLIARAQTSAAG